jgi:uncharacterized membrane protein
MRIALLLHVLSVVVWVGGMFLAYTAVRPAAVETLEPPLRLRLWRGIFRRFFSWVWAAVALLLLTGFSMIGEMERVPAYVQAMAGIGIVMMAIFLHVYFAPYGRLKRAVAAEDWKTGGAALAQIRVLVGVNLLLGVVNVAVALLGPVLG